MDLGVLGRAVSQQGRRACASGKQDFVGVQSLPRLQCDACAISSGTNVELCHDAHHILDTLVNGLLNNGSKSLVGFCKTHARVEEDLVKTVKVGRGERAVPPL